MSQKPGFQVSDENPDRLQLHGSWVMTHVQAAHTQLARLPSGVTQIDLTALDRVDASGAMLIWQISDKLGVAWDSVIHKEQDAALLKAVWDICDHPESRKKRNFGFRDMLGRIGYWVEDYTREVLALLGFGGQALLTTLRVLPFPMRWRVTSTVHHMEQVGLDAVPLVALLSFMIGAVIAFLGATVLRDFGAEIFVVELVGISFLREFSSLLAAILLAGRTASAFTAQIGAMKSGEEIDAIRTMGLDPMELLVLPRLFALVMMLPLLTFVAMIAGILGGMLVGVLNLGLSPEMFLARLQDMLEMRHFWVGMSKAPIFAIVITLIGCLEGFQVQGTAESVGERTTSSVVQCISVVILIDAFAALWFMEMGW